MGCKVIEGSEKYSLSIWIVNTVLIFFLSESSYQLLLPVIPKIIVQTIPIIKKNCLEREEKHCRQYACISQRWVLDFAKNV